MELAEILQKEEKEKEEIEEEKQKAQEEIRKKKEELSLKLEKETLSQEERKKTLDYVKKQVQILNEKSDQRLARDLEKLEDQFKQNKSKAVNFVVEELLR